MILGRSPKQRLDNTTVSEEKEDAIDFSEQQKKFCLSFHYNGAHNYLFLHGVALYFLTVLNYTNSR